MDKKTAMYRCRVRTVGWSIAYGGGLPIVVCAPLHVCILELEPGKRLVVNYILATASDGRSHRPRPERPGRNASHHY